MTVGVDVLPPPPKHSGDRNRTSPMAFTGNRFEFRAVGSDMSLAGPVIAMNTIMAESLAEFADKLEAKGSTDTKDVGDVVAEIVKSVWGECSQVVFNGDGYSDEWHAEAEKRGLPNLRTTADALPVLRDTQVEQLFEKFNVLTPRELESRYEVYAEQYPATVNVESNLMIEMVRTIIFPAAVRYQSELATSLANLKAVGIEPDHDTLKVVTDLIKKLQDATNALAGLKDKEDGFDDPGKHCDFVRDEVLPKMLEVREHADALEGCIADDLWSLPTYQEMLFAK